MRASRSRLVVAVVGLVASAPASATSIAVAVAQVQALAASQTATLTVWPRISSGSWLSGRVDLAAAVDLDPPGPGLEDLPASAPTTPPLSCDVGPTSCAVEATLGATVILEAHDVSNATFAGWAGCSSVTPGPPGSFAPRCKVVMSGARGVTAWFKPATYDLVAKTYTQYGANGILEAPTSPAIRCQTGSTDPDLQACTGRVPNGASITLTAVPQNSRVVSWSGCAPSADLSSCTLAMTVSRVVSATFAPTSYPVNVMFLGGNGTVTGDGVSCSTATGGDCTAEVVAGGSLSLTATPDAISYFVGWGPACSSISGNVCTVSAVTAPKTVYAQFKSKLCQSCHGTPPPPPHLPRYACGTCHSGYTSDTVNVPIHMNGTVEFTHASSSSGEPPSCVECHPCGGVPAR
jgi:hypothetical protein